MPPAHLPRGQACRLAAGALFAGPASSGLRGLAGAEHLQHPVRDHGAAHQVDGRQDHGQERNAATQVAGLSGHVMAPTKDDAVGIIGAGIGSVCSLL